MRRSARDFGSLAFHHLASGIGAASGRHERRLGSVRGKVAILMYHRVVPDDFDVGEIEPGMFVRASTFDRHLGWLRRRFRLRTLGEAAADPPGPDDPPVAVVTFDDGWRDNLTVAWPLLERHAVPATVFVVSDWAAAGTNGEGEFLQPGELCQLALRGIEIGAHTATHPRLSECDDARAESEMRRSREALEAWTGRSCRVFAYPYGAHTERTAEIARRVFDASVVAGGGWWTPGQDRSRVPRIGAHEDMTRTRWLFEARLASGVGS